MERVPLLDPACQLSGRDTLGNLSTPPPYTPNPHIRSPPARKSPSPLSNFRSPSPLPGSVDLGGSDGDRSSHFLFLNLYYPRTSHKVPLLQAPQDGGKGGRGDFRDWSHRNVESTVQTCGAGWVVEVKSEVASPSPTELGGAGSLHRTGMERRPRFLQHNGEQW